MSHNDDAKRWYRSMTQEQRDEYNRRRYERLKAQRAAKARAAGLPVVGDILVCKVCGKTFTCVKANQIYCSNPCRRKAENRRRRAAWRHAAGEEVTAVCQACGVAKKVREPKLPLKLTCVFCGKEFLTDPTHRYAKYCSPLCNMHARRYGGTIAEMEATKAARKAARQSAAEARRMRDAFGLTIAERNAVIKAQCGSRDELWQASQSWTPAQRKFAQARWEELHPTTSFTMSGSY